ncbi:MAG: hypothetical protein ACK559_33570, partial [bacterium]
VEPLVGGVTAVDEATVGGVAVVAKLHLQVEDVADHGPQLAGVLDEITVAIDEAHQPVGGVVDVQRLHGDELGDAAGEDRVGGDIEGTGADGGSTRRGVELAEHDLAVDRAQDHHDLGVRHRRAVAAAAFAFALAARETTGAPRRAARRQHLQPAARGDSAVAGRRHGRPVADRTGHP